MIATDGSHHKEAASMPPETLAMAMRTAKTQPAIRLPVRKVDLVNLRDHIEAKIAAAARTTISAARGDPSR